MSARPRRFLDLAATLLFLVALAAPTIAAILRPRAAHISVMDEQRTPAAAPEKPADLSDLATWPLRFGSWFDDHLGLRDVLLEGRSKLLLFGLGVSPTPSAVIGDDGWLWYAKQTSMESWRGIWPLKQERIRGWTSLLRDRAAWCRSHGIAYVATFVPNKMEVYSERVPTLYDPVGPTRYDQMNDTLRAEPGGWYLDMRAELRDERTADGASDFVYSQRGTHWTSRGAIRGARAILRTARAAGLTSEDPSTASFAMRPMPFDDDNWRLQLHLPGLEFEFQPGIEKNLVREWTSSGGGLFELNSRIETQTAADEQPRAWFVHDSFGGALRPVIAPFFSRATFDWRGVYVFDPGLILPFDPDLVVDLHTERVFDLEPPERVLSADEAQRRARFEGSSATTWRLDPAQSPANAEIGMRFARIEGAIEIASENAAGLVLSDAKLDEDLTSVLRVDVEAERAGAFFLQWSRAGEPGWITKAAIPRKLAQGRQEIHMEVRDTLARGPIRLIPTRDVGTLRFHAIEIRAAGW